ncbi:MAG: DUF1080 domain-containing protein [Cyclobacteriaceae bacterium]|nr:DUF1080 domain-containing protein [Cyclobacteriaceae bacterium]
MRFIYLLLLSFFLSPGLAQAQDNRTTTTRIADALALLPARDGATASLAYAELMSLDEGGLAKVMDGVRPNGDESGVAYRYAVSLLTQSANAAERSRVENALLGGLARSGQEEIKLYFLHHLGLVGSDASVLPLTSLINDTALADAAIGTLQQIGTDRATDALRNALSGKPEKTQIRIVQALGVRRDTKATPLLMPMASSSNPDLKREVLWTLSWLADPSAESLLLEQAAKAGYKGTPVQEMEALIHYMTVRASQGQPAPAVLAALLDHTLAPEQQHYRLVALKEKVTMDPGNAQPVLVKELDRFDDAYRRDVLQLAVATAGVPKNREAWLKEYRKSEGVRQADILAMMAKSNSSDDAFLRELVVPLINGKRISKSTELRTVAIRALAGTRKVAYANDVAEVITRTGVPAYERAEAVQAFLQLADAPHVQQLSERLPKAMPEAQVSILSILSQRRSTAEEGKVIALTASADASVRVAAYHALPYVATPSSVQTLLGLLGKASSSQEVSDVQMALVAIADSETIPAILQATSSQRARLLPVLPYFRDPKSLQMVKTSFEKGSGEEKELAFTALLNWQNGDATGMLLGLMRDPSQAAYRGRALGAYVKQVMSTDWPADQKLLKLREAFALATNAEERRLVLREAGSVRTFLSFMFVAGYINDPELGASATRSAMRLALPTADGHPGQTGSEVRTVLEKVMEKLTGPDSQYDRIDVKNYLDQMPFTQGYEPIFNGKDLSGWQGLVENPIARAKMTKEELAKKQAEADAKLATSWSVKDGMICFTGTGDNLCTKKIYGDFELLVDWRISKNGDSGIYLRGTPQVQIWDTSRVDVGAQVGSGGLYNNTVNRNPLVVADNPIGDWNTLRITMVGEKMTVYLNGQLVVDNVTMENYWDRKLPIFPSGPIELQAHGTELAFRNLYVKELNRPYALSEEEKQQGFELLFNSKDLTGWVGNKTDYVVDDQVITIYPTGRGKGNLYTEKEYSDFIFRFEFQLTPAGNNGLGIHAPLEGDAAYLGKEIQILDDRHPVYHDIKPWQAHGSVYGIIAAKRDALRPVGQWNEEEVEVRGDRIKVTVNGVVIVDGDMKKASAKGTLDGREHPGLQRRKGHIGFLGHGSVVRFRNIRIKDLAR